MVKYTCLTIFNDLINHVADLSLHIKNFEGVENKGVSSTAQQVIEAVLDYAKVSVTIQSYSKAQYYAKAMETPSNPKDTRRVADTSSTSEGVSGLKTNDDGTSTLDGNVYPLKAFVPEEIYLGKLPKVFCDVHREKNMGRSLNLDGKKITGGRIIATAEP